MKTICAEILAIGDELLFGQTLDTNSHWISGELDKVGITVLRRTTVGDVEMDILTAFAEAENRADIILITGGLGPTSDDLTKPCLAKYFNCGLEIHAEALAEVTEFFKSRGRELTETNRQQAALPAACIKITNPIGTAPGMWFDKGDRVFMSMPGVPHEMKKMMTEQVIPRLQQKYTLPVIHHAIIRTIGMGESFLADKISEFEKRLPAHIKLAYLPSLGEVKLRLTATGQSLVQLKQDTTELANQLKEILGSYVYGEGDVPIEAVIGNILREQKLTLALAESCTGGYLSHLITSVPDSSGYFLGSVVAYANASKTNQLGVPPALLETDGAVSESVVKEMAEKVREKFKADIGVATSGIAGPGGATLEKPVGTVWIAYSDKQQTVARKLQLSKERTLNIRYASTAVLNLIRLSLPKATKQANT
jgi:nicotinamide-nucleotide amidase